MGRKGVSKRKSKQTNSKPFAGGNISTAKAAEVQPIRTLDADKAVQTNKSVDKSSSDWKKKSKKG